jgi:hypothetical protein
MPEDTQFLTTTKQRQMKLRNTVAHKKILKEEILQVITENFIENILDLVN